MRLIGCIEKRHLITMMMAFADRKVVSNIEGVSMTGDRFMEETKLEEKDLDLKHSLIDFAKHGRKQIMLDIIDKIRILSDASPV